MGHFTIPKMPKQQRNRTFNARYSPYTLPTPKSRYGGVKYRPRRSTAYPALKRSAVSTMSNRPGFPIGTATAKKVASYFNADAVNGTTLYTALISNIPKGDLINERERDIVNIEGYIVQMHIHSKASIPIKCRWAVVSPRQTWDLTTAATAGADFLRSHGTTRSLAIDPGNGGFAMTQNPINSDSYMVLAHGQCDLGPAPGATNYTSNVKPNWHTIKKWVPLNKQLRFATGINAEAETPIYFAYWLDSDVRKGGQTIADINPAGAIDTRIQTTCYFKEPKG